MTSRNLVARGHINLVPANPHASPPVRAITFRTQLLKIKQYAPTEPFNLILERTLASKRAQAITHQEMDQPSKLPVRLGLINHQLVKALATSQPMDIMLALQRMEITARFQLPQRLLVLSQKRGYFRAWGTVWEMEARKYILHSSRLTCRVVGPLSIFPSGLNIPV